MRGVFGGFLVAGLLSCWSPPAAVVVAPHALRVVIVGDSVAHGVGDESGLGLAGHLDRELARLGIVHAAPLDLAQGGSRTWNLSRVSVTGADAIVVSIGGNDLYGDSRARLLFLLAPRLMMDVTLDRIDSIVSSLRRANRDAHIVLLGVYDPYGRADLDRDTSIWSSKLYARFASRRGVTVLPIADIFARSQHLSPLDHFHPSADGYARIARRIAESF